MKKVLISILLFWGIVAQTPTAQAQNVTSKQDDTQSTKTKVDALIKKEQVKTGILYNRTMPFVGLHAFGQNGVKEASNFQHFNNLNTYI